MITDEPTDEQAALELRWQLILTAGLHHYLRPWRWIEVYPDARIKAGCREWDQWREFVIETTMDEWKAGRN